jgi:hypothetical protein
VAKSKYADKLNKGLPLLQDLKEGEIGRLRDSLPKYRTPILEAWEDLAGSERLVKENHQGRYLFELIQNANDALVDAGTDANRLARTEHRIRIELSEHSLLIANFGQPFGEDNVRALRRLHKTTKRIGALQEESGQLSRSKRIGHKGIGFKSVLEITNRPEVYSDVYAFGFDVNEFRQDVARHISDAQNWSLPTFRVPYPRNINRIPQYDREQIEKLFDDGFATVIRLPLDEPQIVESITHRIEQDVQPELLLFMTAISRIEVRFADTREITYERRVGSVGDTQLDMVLLYRHDAAGEHLESRWLTLQATRRLDDRLLVSGLGEAWKDVEALGFAIAFPLKRREAGPGTGDDSEEPVLACESAEPFHVYYPTHECSGLDFKIHADFYVGDDRKSIPPEKPINKWLINEICDFLSGEGLDYLKRQWPFETELVHRLLPVDRPEGSFARSFMETYLAMLRVAPFVPIPGQNYKAPEDVRLPPLEVDQQQFRLLFPSSRLRGAANWTYPTSDVVEQEIAREVYREQHPDALRLLLRPELGAEFVSIDLVITAIEEEGLPPTHEADELIAFLADWHAELPGPERRVFIERLQSLPIYPTVSGWSQPGTALVFQANVRAEVDEDTVPDGFAFSVIRRSVYPAERGATASNQYKLFDALGAREYSRRSLIVEAILPVVTNDQRFSELCSTHPDSIFQAYRLLRDYFEDRGTTRDFEQRLARVPVPAADGKGWHAAGDCYFGASWPDQNGELLRRIYEGFPDCFFLADIPQLELDELENRQEWAAFFRWLGVADHPRVIASERRIERGGAAPLENMPYWAEYLKAHDSDFWCPNLTAHHRYSRGLQSVHSIHHFAELVQEQDVQKLVDLFVLLGNHWESHYKPLSRTIIACNRVTCARDQIDDYLLFELQHAHWLPAQVSEHWTEPLSPRQIWSLGETDPSDARALVPTLPEDLKPSAFREFVAALGFVSSSTAGIEDYVRLLSLLPERYPVSPSTLPESEHRRWQRSLAAVFNWICERVQTGLVSRGENSPDPPTDLQVLAYINDKPTYVPLGSPELVYANDNFLAERWKEQCAFLRINDDWRTLLNWLGVPDLSDVVQSEWQPVGELEQESERLRGEFEAALPYYLSLIKHAQPANYDRLVPRLLRLDLHVVKELSTKEWLEPLPDVQPVVSKVDVQLEKRDDPNPGAGRRFVIAGDLYVARDAANNLDLLGDYVADYIEIARLADAFVILINRASEQEKWRFLKSKGVTEDTLAEVLSDMQTRTAPDGQDGQAGLTIAEMVKRITDPEPTPEVVPTSSGFSEPAGTNGRPPGEETGADGETEEPQQSPVPDYPELELGNLPGVHTATPVDNGTQAEGNGQKKRRRKGATGTSRVPRQEVTEALGKRGEEWAYENEKLRLKTEYGFDPQELEELQKLVWVSRRKPTANHDIRSVRVTESGEQRALYIEVKASAGDSRNIWMGRQEFLLAMSLGEDYWLYWVANVDEARPDAPVCYKNFAQLVAEEKLVIDVGTLALTLPKSESE